MMKVSGSRQPQRTISLPKSAKCTSRPPNTPAIDASGFTRRQSVGTVTSRISGMNA